MGYRLMYKLLSRQGVACSRSRVREVYANLNLLGRRAPPRAQTTNSRHNEPRYPNLVKDLAIQRPDQVWVADTTFLKVARRTAYLALVEDAYTRRVVGWSLGFTNDASFVMSALEQALTRGRPEIHHSDQGTTYAAKCCTSRLLKLGTSLSMAAVGKAWENGLAERLNRTFKEEEIRRSEYDSLSEALSSIAAYVKLYNEQRIHMSLGYKTPLDVFQSFGHDQNAGEQSP